MSLRQTLQRRQLTRALARHLPTLLRAIDLHDGDLDRLARSILWDFDDAGCSAFSMHAGALPQDEVRDVLVDFLHRATRTSLREASVQCLADLRESAIVFTMAHAQCLLVRVTAKSRTYRVVGSGLPLSIADLRTPVIAPHRSWLHLHEAPRCV